MKAVLSNSDGENIASGRVVSLAFDATEIRLTLVNEDSFVPMPTQLMTVSVSGDGLMWSQECWHKALDINPSQIDERWMSVSFRGIIIRRKSI